MLANLLPGLRDVRAPLASGYVLLISLWLGIPNARPSVKYSHDVIADLWKLSNMVGKGASLAAVTFIAYLIGSMLHINARSALKYFDAKREVLLFGGGWFSNVDWPLIRRDRDSIQVSAATLERLIFHLQKISGSDDSQEIQEKVLQTQNAVLAELGNLEIRLHARSADLYGDHDRTAAEADLRINVGLSLSILICVLVLRGSLWWTVGLCASFYLIKQGFTRARQANDVLIEITLSEELDSSSISSFRREFEAETGGVHFTSLDDLIANRMRSASSSSPDTGASPTDERTS
ncbi:hypothetical protein [Streptomyces sp. NPDC059080]|uniref:hypothetical protein n=1 Tax=Streptomyces sp. NPDC059080 TaxID=3346718 RepID=UPI0036CD37E5